MNLTTPLHRGIYAITDCARLPFGAVLEKSAIILDCGATALQYRDKNASSALRRERAAALLALCRARAVPLIVNDDPALALELGAGGVHLGADDPDCGSARALLGPRALIGVSCYADLDAARRAVAAGADYIAFGAFYPTSTKQPRARAAPPLLRAARNVFQVPLVAIGGITVENAGALLAAGADVLAVAGALYSAPDPAQVMRDFRRLFAEQT